MEESLFYVVILESTTIVGIGRTSPPQRISGTDLFLLYRPAEGKNQEGVALLYRDGRDDLVDMVSADAWRKLPLGAQHLPLKARLTFRVFSDRSTALKSMGAKLLADDEAKAARARR